MQYKYTMTGFQHNCNCECIKWQAVNNAVYCISTPKVISLVKNIQWFIWVCWLRNSASMLGMKMHACDPEGFTDGQTHEYCLVNSLHIFPTGDNNHCISSHFSRLWTLDLVAFSHENSTLWFVACRPSGGWKCDPAMTLLWRLFVWVIAGVHW